MLPHDNYITSIEIECVFVKTRFLFTPTGNLFQDFPVVFFLKQGILLY